MKILSNDVRSASPCSFTRRIRAYAIHSRRKVTSPVAIAIARGVVSFDDHQLSRAATAVSMEPGAIERASAYNASLSPFWMSAGTAIAAPRGDTLPIFSRTAHDENGD